MSDDDFATVVRKTVEFFEVGLARHFVGDEWANPVSVEFLRDASLRSVVAEFRSFLAAGCPQEVSVSISAPANLWAWLKKSLGFRRYRTTVQTSTRTVYATVCPHLAKPTRDHLGFIEGKW